MVTASDKAVAARVLRDAGHATGIIADLLHASERTVRRWLQTTPEVEHSASALDDFEHLIASADLDDYARFQAGVARGLAVKLDKVRASDKAQTGTEMANISKELRSIVAEIMGASQDDREWLAGLLTAVDDPTHPEPENSWIADIRDPDSARDAADAVAEGVE